MEKIVSLIHIPGNKHLVDHLTFLTEVVVEKQDDKIIFKSDVFDFTYESKGDDIKEEGEIYTKKLEDYIEEITKGLKKAEIEKRFNLESIEFKGNYLYLEDSEHLTPVTFKFKTAASFIEQFNKEEDSCNDLILQSVDISPEIIGVPWIVRFVAEGDYHEGNDIDAPVVTGSLGVVIDIMNEDISVTPLDKVEED